MTGADVGVYAGPGELEALLRGTFAALLRDDDFDVRKVTSSSFPCLPLPSDAAAVQYASGLGPAFEGLPADATWRGGVQDAAASVSAIAAVAPEALRQGILLDFFQEAAKVPPPPLPAPRGSRMRALSPSSRCWV